MAIESVRLLKSSCMCRHRSCSGMFALSPDSAVMIAYSFSSGLSR